MYEERKEFSFRDFAIQLLLVILFVGAMIWLFPTKNYLANTYATKDDVNTIIDERLEFIYGRIFADNVESMKEAATGYFTTSRLPKKVGDEVTITLEEMLEKKLVLPFKDSNNQTCDLTKSYVKMTKMDDEYQMKVQLSCSDYSDYVIAYMGCYNYCDKAICEAKTTTKQVTTPAKKVTPTPVVATKTYYKYRLTTQNEYSAWGNWSGWSTTVKATDKLTQVETKKTDVLTGYEQVWGVVDYKTTTKQVQAGTKNITSGSYISDTKDATATATNGTYSDWTYAGTVTTTNRVLYDTNTEKYSIRSTNKYLNNCINSCTYNTDRVYTKYVRTYTAGETSYSCPTGYTLSGTKCYKYSNNTTTQPVYKDVTTYEPVYGWVNGAPIYKTVQYYRYRTRTLLREAGTYYELSLSDNDTNLLSKDYVLIGKEV